MITTTIERITESTCDGCTDRVGNWAIHIDYHDDRGHRLERAATHYEAWRIALALAKEA